MVELAQVQATLTDLWRQLGGNPANRALLVARLAANHADNTTQQHYAGLIARCTPPGEARTAALQLLQPKPIPTLKIVPARDYTNLRVDGEMGRLSVALSLAAPFRLWVVGRDITRRERGSGIITKQALKSRLVALGVVYTPRHFNRLLAGGEGLFWTLNGSTLYLRSAVKVGLALVHLADEAGVYMTFNRPGVRDVLLDVSGSLERWEAMLYAGWVAGRGYKQDVMIARDTLAMLFRRHKNTIRRWETTRLQTVVSKRTNFVQCPDAERYYRYIPMHARAYVARVRFKNTVREEVRIRWQLPNSYHSTLWDYAHKGQAGKVRRAVNAVFPAADKRGGHLPLIYLPSAERMKRLYASARFRRGEWGDVNRAFYVYVGDHHRTKQRMFEITDNGFLFTHPNERLRPEHEYGALYRRVGKGGT